MNDFNFSANPLVDDNTSDTLINVQSVLLFVQEFAARLTEDASLSGEAVRANQGLHAILKTANNALMFEIKRLEEYAQGDTLN